MCSSSSSSSRCCSILLLACLCSGVHVGDPDIRRETVPRSAEQRRDWQDRGGREAATAAELSTTGTVQPHVCMLVLWLLHTALGQRSQDETGVRRYVDVEFISLLIQFSVVTLPPIWEQSIVMSMSVCVCVCVCVCLSTSYLRNCMSDLNQTFSHVTYGHGSVHLWWRSDILPPVLWMTSYLLINQGARGRHPAEAHCTCSLGLGYKLCAVITVAGQQTHGSTFRTVRVTSQLATTGMESTVCGCLVFLVFVNISHGSVIRWRMRFVILMTDTWRIKRCVIIIVVDLSSY